MKRKLLVILAAAMLCGMCGCVQKSSSEGSAEDSNTGLTVHENSDGGIVFEFDSQNSFEEVGGSLINRTDEKTPEIPEGGISLEEAGKIVDSCSFKDFYLPSEIKNYKKYYYSTTKFNGKDHYLMYLYLEKNGIKMFAGTKFLVACDGKKVYSADWTGSYREEKLDSVSQNPDTKELYKDAKITPEEALFVLNKAEPSSLKLKESVFAYTFETDAKLYEKKSIFCYKITPKLEYENGISMSEPIYVTADGTDRIIMSDGDDYKQVL